ncbi:hypothetical protein [Pseudomonas savastanoi]|uniref:hypothetical protein n=1 Tax=Pseudomonas savastanoi TaxID=29438 RepID=UPI000E32A80E|nr:hypothetical protein [Pseudomonas savastanoi]
MDIKKMPLVDDLAQSLNAVKDHLPVQTAKDLSGMMERSFKFNKLSKIGILAMGVTAVVSLILSGLGHYFAPSAGIAEFDVPRVLIDSFSSSWQTGGGGGGMSQFDNVEGALAGFIAGPVMKTILLIGTIIGLGAAVVRQSFTPLMAVILLGGTTTMIGPVFNLTSPQHDSQASSGLSPREQFESAIRKQDSPTLRTFLTDSSPAVTYLKAQLAIKDGTLNLPSVGETAKAIASGNLGFEPNNQVAYAIESAADVKHFSGPAKAYADPATAKAELFSSLSHWVGIATLMFGLPGIAVLLLHIAIQRRIRRIGRLSVYLLGH